MKPILLLDKTLQVEINFSSEDCDLEDNICVKVLETCPEDEKIFKHEESHIFLTRKQAQDLTDALGEAIRKSEEASF